MCFKFDHVLSVFLVEHLKTDLEFPIGRRQILLFSVGSEIVPNSQMAGAIQSKW